MKDKSLAFNPDFLIDPGSALFKEPEHSLIYRLLDALEIIFSEVPCPDASRWRIGYEKVQGTKLEYFNISVLLNPEMNMSLVLRVFPGNPNSEIPGIGLTTATLSKTIKTKQGLETHVLDRTDLVNSEWMDFVGWLSVAHDKFICETKPSRYLVTQTFEMHRVAYVGYPYSFPSLPRLTVQPGVLEVSPDRSQVRIPGGPWLEIEPKSLDVYKAVQAGYLIPFILYRT